MSASTLVPIAPLGSTLTNVPAGNIAATTVQGAINELDNEKVAKAGDTMTGNLNLASNKEITNDGRSWIQMGASGTTRFYATAGMSFYYDGVNRAIYIPTATGYVGLGTTTVNSRLSLAADTSAAGGIVFGTDTNLYRSAADTLKTDDSLISNTHYVVTAASSTTAYVAQATGDATGRFAMTASGSMSWGDGTNARDTTLYRSAADILKTDDALVVGGTSLAIGTNPANTGVLRIPNNVWAYARNAANDADVPLFILTNTNKTALNSGVEVQLSIGTTPKFQVAAALNTSVSDLAIGANPATTGYLRLPYQGSIWTRNATNDGDKALLAGGVGYTAIYALAGETVYFNIGGANPLEVTAGALKATGVLTTGTNPAQSGQLRLPNNAWVSGRTADNLGDIGMLSATTADHTMVNAITGKNVFLAINGTRRMSIADTSVSTQAGVSMVIGGDSLSIGATPATAGAFRMTAGQALYWRDAGNTANHLVLQNASDVTTVRGEGYVNITTNGGTFLQASASSVNVTAGATFSLADGVPVTTGTTTGTKLMTATNQKFAAWNKTPDVQPTTAITGSAFVANSGTAVNDASTFGGYTLAQIAAALIREGWLA